MDQNYEDRNKSQIIRVDARSCFVESKSDAFEIGKVHLEFAAYDATKPSGQRQTNHVHIYIDIPAFLCLAHDALAGTLHNRARQMKVNEDNSPLYECLGGTSAEKLEQYNRPRPDGKSLSRTVKLINGKKDGFYLFVADSGPGEADKKGLIVPKFGKTPENHVAVSMSWRAVNELMVMTQAHYGAWLAAKYAAESGRGMQAPINKQPAKNTYPPANTPVPKTDQAQSTKQSAPSQARVPQFPVQPAPTQRSGNAERVAAPNTAGSHSDVAFF